MQESRKIGLNDGQLRLKEAFLVFRKEISIPYREVQEIKKDGEWTIVSTYFVDLRMKLSDEKKEQLLKKVKEWKIK